jgi:hypothetical protein
VLACQAHVFCLMVCLHPCAVLVSPCQAANAKHALMDLRFYLEVPWPPGTTEQVPARSDINLFFKFYDWKVGFGYVWMYWILQMCHTLVV